MKRSHTHTHTHKHAKHTHAHARSNMQNTHAHAQTCKTQNTHAHIQTFQSKGPQCHPSSVNKQSRIAIYVIEYPTVTMSNYHWPIVISGVCSAICFLILNFLYKPWVPYAWLVWCGYSCQRCTVDSLLIRPPLGSIEVSWLEGWPPFRGGTCIEFVL